MGYTVHKYYVKGLPHPLDRIEAIIEQRRLYWNSLVEVERKYFTAVNGVMGEKPPAEDARAWRKQRKAECGDALKLAEADRCSAVAAAEKNSGLWWGQARSVMAAYNSARSGFFTRGKGHVQLSPRDSSAGQCGTLLMSGYPVAGSAACNRYYFGVHPNPSFGWERSAHRWHAFRLRMGSVDREPEWACGHLRLHRPLPEGELRSVYLSRQQRGGAKPKWYVCVVAKTEERQRDAGPTVEWHLDIRQKTDGVAVAESEIDGQVATITVPLEIADSFAKAASIDEEADRVIAAAGMPEIVLLAKHRDAIARGEPSPVKEAAQRVMHLRRYAQGMRDGAAARRREMFRVEAKLALSGASACIIPDVWLRLQRGPKKSLQIVAAPSVLLDAIRNYCTREGVKILGKKEAGSDGRSQMDAQATAVEAFT